MGREKGEGRRDNLSMTMETSTGDDELQLLRREGSQYVYICFGDAKICAKSEPVHWYYYAAETAQIRVHVRF